MYATYQSSAMEMEKQNGASEASKQRPYMHLPHGKSRCNIKGVSAHTASSSYLSMAESISSLGIVGGRENFLNVQVVADSCVRNGGGMMKEMQTEIR